MIKKACRDLFKMLEVTKSIEWDMAHRIPNHSGKCQYPHGHRYRLEVTVKGELLSEKGASDEGMLIDFADFKKILRQKIYGVLDHRFLAAEEDELLKKAFSGDLGEKLKIIYVPFIPTAENILLWCFKQIKKDFPENISLSKLRLYESPKNWVDYSPSPAN